MKPETIQKLELIFDFIKENPKSSSLEISQELEIKPSVIYDLLKKLIQLDYITHEKDYGKKGACNGFYLYRYSAIKQSFLNPKQSPHKLAIQTVSLDEFLKLPKMLRALTPLKR